MNYSSLREKYPEFLFKSYSIEESETEIKVSYNFETVSLCQFNPSWIFKKPSGKSFKDNKILEKLIFSLGMVELVSYWKATCSPTVKILCKSISEGEAEWFKKLYFKGLGEFFYINKIDADISSFMNIVSMGEAIIPEGEKVSGNKNLISIGGGKDSVVSLETLSSLKEDNFCYIINPDEATKATAKMGGYKDDKIIAVKRSLDRKIVELNSEGFLNGHTPFSAIVAFSSTISAYLWGIKNVVLSNENSANESTVKGTDVNHQYSKSFEFECDFRSFEEKFVSSGVNYFSLLRPLSEFQIAKFFSEKCENYHSVFRSCNLGGKTDSWCCNCPKCLFITIILAPFLSHDEIKEIFGENLLTKEKMLSDYDKLLGLSPEKPFECVGMRSEVILASYLTLKKYQEERKALPLLISHFSEIMDENYDTEGEYLKTISQFNENNNLSPDFEKILREKFSL